MQHFTDTYILHSVVYACVGFSLLLVTIVFMLVRFQKRQYKYATEKKEREYQYQNETLNAQLQLQEYLLNHVSREIHDNVGQVLSLVKLHLFSAGNQEVNTKTTQLLQTSSKLLDKAIDDLRNVGHAHSGSLVQQLGLIGTIKKEIGYINSLRTDICELSVNGDPYSLTLEQELLIYRIAQEAIQNSLKHAACSKINIAVHYSESELLLAVTDNGSGFDASETPANPGIGIAHMKHRAKLLHADLSIVSERSHGTMLTLKIPVRL